MAPGAGEGDELKLLGAWPSPFVHRVRLALHLKGSRATSTWRRTSPTRATCSWPPRWNNPFFAAWIKSLKGTTEDEKATGTAGALAALLTLEGAFVDCSKGRPFFAGDAPGYMDVALGGYLGWMRAYEAVAGVNLLDAGRTTLLVAWTERFAALDAAKGVIPEVHKIVQFAKALQARTAATATSNN